MLHQGLELCREATRRGAKVEAVLGGECECLQALGEYTKPAVACEETAPGYAAAAYQAFADAVPGSPVDERHRTCAQAAIDAPKGVGFDLGLYVEVRAGRAVILPPGGRPTGALAQAHQLLKRGDVEGVRSVLEDGCRRSHLVHALATLDPKLAPFTPLQ